MNASSNIASVQYDEAKRELHVTFHSGSQYTYHSVSPEEYYTFANADSPGKHFHQHIKTNNRRVTRVK